MDTILTGSARDTVASLRAKIEALEARIAEQPQAKAKAGMPAFRTKALRKAGKGWPCTAPEPCGRKDLRTKARAAAHGIEKGHFAR